MDEEPVLLRIDVGRAAVVADVVQRARRDDPFERLDRGVRHAGSRREVAVGAHDMAHDRRLEARRLAVAGEGRAVDTLPGLPRELLRRARRRYRSRCGAAYESRALCQKTPTALFLFIHGCSSLPTIVYFARCLSKNCAISVNASRVSGALTSR